MKTSRQKILEYIHTQRVATAADLGRDLHMTQANARHHLALLLEQGRVEIAGQRQPEGKGRPAQLYRLSDESLGHSLDRLASALLDLYLDKSDQSAAQADLTPAERLAHIAQVLSAGGEAIPGGHLTRRLYATVRKLNQLNYQAHWEAHADAPRIILGHCPYAAILEEHPELCQMDAALIERLVRSAALQEEKLARDVLGARFCRFRLAG